MVLKAFVEVEFGRSRKFKYNGREPNENALAGILRKRGRVFWKCFSEAAFSLKSKGLEKEVAGEVLVGSGGERERGKRLFGKLFGEEVDDGCLIGGGVWEKSVDDKDSFGGVNSTNF